MKREAFLRRYFTGAGAGFEAIGKQLICFVFQPGLKTVRGLGVRRFFLPVALHGLKGLVIRRMVRFHHPVPEVEVQTIIGIAGAMVQVVVGYHVAPPEQGMSKVPPRQEFKAQVSGDVVDYVVQDKYSVHGRMKGQA
jgi:hypothetical protein